MQYSTGFERIVEETMERPDNAWCKKFFKNKGSETVAQDMADLDEWYNEEYAKIPDDEKEVADNDQS